MTFVLLKLLSILVIFEISNSYTMGCQPVRGDNPRALANGLSMYRWTNMVYLFYTTYISVDLAHREIFRA